MKSQTLKLLALVLFSCALTSIVSATTITGAVFRDTDGGTITGTGINFPGIYINVVQGGSVIGTTQASSANGTYSVSVTQTSGAATIILATTATATTASIPANLSYSAEGNTAAGDGTANGTINITLTNAIVAGYNFAVNFINNQPPVANNVTQSSIANLPGNARFIINALNGITPPEKPIDKVTIVTLPNAATMGTLYYNGVAVTVNQTIQDYFPSLLTIDPVDGTPTVVFTYKVVDNQNVTSTNTGTVTVPFSVVGFPCDAVVRFTRQIPLTGPSQTLLSYPDFSGQTFTVTTSDTLSMLLNASVYYNGYIYAMVQGNTSDLRELHGDGSTTLYTIAGMPTGSYNNAGVSARGIMYIMSGTNLLVINLNTKTYVGSYPTTGIADAANFIWGDIAVAPGGSIFAWYHPTDASNTAAKGLYRLNIATNAGGAITGASFIKVGASVYKTMGSLVFDNSGKLYAYGSNFLNGNQDRFFQIDTTTGLTTQVADPSLQVGQSDGCSCPFTIGLQNTSSATCLSPGQTFNNYFTITNLTGGVTIAGAAFTDTLDSRFSYSYTTAGFNALLASLRATYGAATNLTFSNVNGGTNNLVLITGMVLPNSTSSFSLAVLTRPDATFGASETISNFGYLLNMPGPYGTILKSDDPNTSAVGDYTAIGNPSFNISSTVGTSGCSTILTANRGSNYGAVYTYQWYLNGTLIPGATGQTYTAPGAGGPYTVQASSTSCTLPVSPAITVQPCISGNLYNDVNGITDGIVNGTGTGTIGTTQYYAVLRSTGTGAAILQTVPVNSNGSYAFPNVTPNAAYDVYITSVASVVGSPDAPLTATLAVPTGYVRTGENVGNGNDGTADFTLRVNLANTTITNANFGYDARPVVNSAVGGSQPNPGNNTNTVNVPTSLFSGGDQNDLNNAGGIKSIRVSAFPTATTSFAVGTIRYYSGSLPGSCPGGYTCELFPGGGLTIPTNTSGNPIEAIVLDPTTASTSSVFTFYTIDYANVESSNPGTVTMPFSASASISGTVYNDANGTSNSLIDGSGIGTAGSQLYAHLTNAGTSTIVATVTLPASGIYNFANVSNGNYDIVLSTSSNSLVTTLPTGWVNTAEGSSGTGDGTANGRILSVTVAGNLGIGGLNFGIDNLPTPVGSTSASQANPGGLISASVPLTAFSGTDAGDQSNAGRIDSIRITAFPTGANTITINGITYNATTFATALAAGLTKIATNASGVPLTPISVDPSFFGAGDVTIPFSTVDNAGKVSATTAIVIVPFTDISVKGTVYHDANGMVDGFINGTPKNIIGSNTLRANLVDPATNLVLGSVPVDANGNYTLTTTNGLTINSNFKVVITNGMVANGAATSTTSLIDATYTGEGLNVNGDGLADGSTLISVDTKDITGVNFGIEKLPDSDPKSYSITQPFGRTTIQLNSAVAGKPGKLTGSDTEDGNYDGTNLTNTVILNPAGMNGNTLLYNGVPVTTTTTIAGYNPALLTVRFDGLNSTGLSFTYAYVDVAGKADPTPANYIIGWATPLPVSLIDFNAVAKEKVTLINWTTATEQNAAYYEVQRSSDAISFETIGQINAKGTSSTKSEYAFTDIQPLNGRNFYRLRIIDKGNSYQFSETKMVIFTTRTSGNILLFPNPAKNAVSLKGIEDGSTIQLLNTEGKVLITTINTGDKATIDIAQLASGVYFIRINNKDVGEYLKFIKQ